MTPTTDRTTLAVDRRRNRLRLIATLAIATVLYWLAVMIAAVVGGLLLALRVLVEGGDVLSSDDLEIVGIGLLAVVAISALVGSIVAALRLPRQRRRLERQVLAETGATVVTADATDDADGGEHRQIRNLLDGLAIAAHIPPPRFAVIEDPAPNSFAVGTRPANAIVAVTTGAVTALTRDELEAVLAYEVSRIGSWDVALSSWTVALTGAAIGALDDDGITEFVGRLPFRASVRLRTWALRDTALDRDRAAVRFTRNPSALLRALEAMRANPLEVERVSAATAPLWMEVPSRVLGSGPSLDERITALEHLGGR